MEDVETCPVCGAPVRQDEDVLDTWFCSASCGPSPRMGWTRGGHGRARRCATRYPDPGAVHRARHHGAVGGAHGHGVHVLLRRGRYPFDARDHPSHGHGGRRQAHDARAAATASIRCASCRTTAPTACVSACSCRSPVRRTLKFNEAKLESTRNFANKVKNAAPLRRSCTWTATSPARPSPRTPADRWIFSRLARARRCAWTRRYDNFEFGEITRELYSFVSGTSSATGTSSSRRARLGADADPADRVACQRNLVFVLDQVAAPAASHHAVRDRSRSTSELPVDAACAAPIPHRAPRGPTPRPARTPMWTKTPSAPSPWSPETVSGRAFSTRARYGISPKTALAVAVKVAGRGRRRAASEAQRGSASPGIGNTSRRSTSPRMLKSPPESSCGAGNRRWRCTSCCRAWWTSPPSAPASRRSAAKRGRRCRQVREEAFEPGLPGEGGPRDRRRRTAPSSPSSPTSSPVWTPRSPSWGELLQFRITRDLIRGATLVAPFAVS